MEIGDSLKHIWNVTFSGIVRFGLFEESFILAGGVRKHSGLKNVTLHNVCVGDNSYIGNISNYVANYDIGARTLIENVDVIVTEGESSFGNGTEVSVLNETGGREVAMVERLSAHLAYIMALYRHRPLLSDRLRAITDRFTREHTSKTGTIGSDVTIRNTGSITDVRIGDCAVISGAGRLRNGTIVSNPDAPVTIGYNYPSEKVGQKGIIKVSDKFFTDDEISRLSVVAPNVVLNIIHDYEVVEKKTVRTPDELRGIVRCNNPKCITNNEPMATVFHMVDKEKGILKCHYCDKEQNIEEVELS